MPEHSFDFFEKKVLERTIANQVIHNYVPLWHLYEALHITDPDMAREKQERMRELAQIAAGTRKHPTHDEYVLPSRPVSRSWGIFRGLWWRKSGACGSDSRADRLRGDRRTGVSGIRSVFSLPLLGQSEHYFLNEYAAATLGIPAVKRQFELHAEHNRVGGDEELWDLEDPGGIRGQLPHATRGVVKKAEEVHAGMDEIPSTDYRLPAEREEDTVFVDEYFSCVAFRLNEATLFARFGADDIAILRYKTPEFDRLAQVEFSSRGPQIGSDRWLTDRVLKSMRYGPYFIVMNGSEEESFEFDVPEELQGAQVTELKSGKQEELSATEPISPMSSYVFVLNEK